MSFPPDVYLIGAQKSGTTTLSCLLQQHPDICKCKDKEPHFFTRNWNRGLSWYQKIFPDYENTVCLDASTSYSMAPLGSEGNPSHAWKRKGVPQRLYSVNPDAKFIYLLRNPIERTYSGYWHYVYKGREHKNFESAIKSNSIYLDISNYYGQLELWLEYFPIESFQFVLFEDLKENPEKVVRDCFKFIGIDSSTQIQIAARNKSKHVNSTGRAFNRVFKGLDHSGYGYLAPGFIRTIVKNNTIDGQRSYPKMQEEDQVFLREYFSNKNYNLELLTGLSLSHWCA